MDRPGQRRLKFSVQVTTEREVLAEIELQRQLELTERKSRPHNNVQSDEGDEILR